MTDDSDNDPDDLIEIINDWKLYFEKHYGIIHAVIGDDKFTYSFLDSNNTDDPKFVSNHDQIVKNTINETKVILSSYHNGSNDQLSLNLA